jgi:hypothetical protein
MVVGTSTLTRTESGVSFTLQTTGLDPGHAVTIWCMVTNPDGGVAVLYATGRVIGKNGGQFAATCTSAIAAATSWVTTPAWRLPWRPR